MTLAKQITWTLTAVVAGFVLVAGAGIWAMLVAQDNTDLVRREYTRFEMVQGAAGRMEYVRDLLDLVARGIDSGVESPGDAHLRETHDATRSPAGITEATHRILRAARQIEGALNDLERLRSDLDESGASDSHAASASAYFANIDEAEGRLAEVHALLRQGINELAALDLLVVRVPLGDALRALRGLVSQSREHIVSIHARTADWIRTAVGVMIVVSLIVIVAVVALSIWQYRSVTRPIERLRTGVHRIAAGDFSHRLDATGCAEFVALSNDFNRTAAELHDVYADLEERVRTASKKLARAEQLASVGYLAAAVSHEINNPIGIIAGYAESALRIAGQQPENAVPAEVIEALEIVRDEAFRCKKITGQLLSLSRGPDEPVAEVSIAHLVREVADMLRGLTKYADRRIEVSLADGDALTIRSAALEIKQALLNVAVNALDAVPPNTGVVTFEGNRRNGVVQLTVRDNGSGMTPAVLDKVFEPFFSTRRGGEGHGVGLGMSITQAIIERNGGQIIADSAGPGQGSTFTITLPDRSDPPSGSPA